jgi:hypothetical protein
MRRRLIIRRWLSTLLHLLVRDLAVLIAGQGPAIPPGNLRRTQFQMIVSRGLRFFFLFRHWVRARGWHDTPHRGPLHGRMEPLLTLHAGSSLIPDRFVNIVHDVLHRFESSNHFRRDLDAPLALDLLEEVRGFHGVGAQIIDQA